LLDFGLAKAVEDPAGPSDDPSNSPTLTLGATRVGVIMGTAAYMSPEQASGTRADRRADIWSFGAVLYEMLAGEKAFEGEWVSDTLANVLKLDPDWDALPAETPASIRSLIRRCLMKDRKQRLQAIGEARIALEAPVGAEIAPQTEVRPARLPWAVATGLAVIAVALGWIAWRSTRPVERPLIQLSSELGPDFSLALGVGGSIALSPDGTLLALTVRGADGQTRLATRRIDQNRLNVLAGTDGAQGPFFSPDHRWIAFSVSGALKKISAYGGAPVMVYNAYSIGGSWGEDGNIVAVLGIGAGLTRIAGGMPTPITQIKPDRLGADRFPQVLPWSQEVLFSSYDYTRDPDDSDIDVISLKTGQRKHIYHGGFFARYLPSGHLVFIHQNTLFAAPFDVKSLALKGEPQPVLEDLRNGYDQGGNFDFSRNGTFVYLSGRDSLRRAIFWLDSGGRLQPLQSNPGNYTFPRFAPDGKHLAYWSDDGQGHTDIYVRDLEHDRTQRLTTPGRNGWPVWTPDSEAIIFEADNPSGVTILWMHSDGSGEPRRLAEFKGFGRPAAVSSDGKWLALIGRGGEVGEGGGVSISIAPIEGDPDHPTLGKITTFVSSASPNIWPQFSPDGRWVAYMSGDPGNRGVIVRAFPGPGGPRQIDSTGAFPA
jgi:serine/threonine-protein kinase